MVGTQYGRWTEEQLNEGADYVFARLRQGKGSVVKMDPLPGQGKSQTFYFVPMHVLDDDQKGLLLAMEGGGCRHYVAERAINTFQLISAGFPLYAGADMTTLVNMILNRMLDQPLAIEHKEQTDGTE